MTTQTAAQKAAPGAHMEPNDNATVNALGRTFTVPAGLARTAGYTVYSSGESRWDSPWGNVDWAGCLAQALGELHDAGDSAPGDSAVFVRAIGIRSAATNAARVAEAGVAAAKLMAQAAEANMKAAMINNAAERRRLEAEGRL